MKDIAEKGIAAACFILEQAAIFGRKRGEQPAAGNVCRKTTVTKDDRIMQYMIFDGVHNIPPVIQSLACMMQGEKGNCFFIKSGYWNDIWQGMKEFYDSLELSETMRTDAGIFLEAVKPYYHELSDTSWTLYLKKGDTLELRPGEKARVVDFSINQLVLECGEKSMFAEQVKPQSEDTFFASRLLLIIKDVIVCFSFIMLIFAVVCR
jgi:hypothetical protein